MMDSEGKSSNEALNQCREIINSRNIFVFFFLKKDVYHNLNHVYCN